jgi:squalene-hopene/tetraprenyl-beta-curcumene cyclase
MSLAAHAADPTFRSATAEPNVLDAAIARAKTTLLDQQRADGHYAYDLEADAAIPAEYIMVKHFLGQVDPEMERRTANYLRRLQEPHGGWPKLARGGFDMSASVKAYFALKISGDSVDAPHMAKAREAILSHGGAAHMNIFTRMMLAFFDIVPWSAVPVMPVELMHAPGWFPINIWRFSYWARDTVVPLLVLMARKPKARNPRRVGIDELFHVSPFQMKRWPKTANQVGFWGAFFVGLDKVLRVTEPLFPKASRESAIRKAVDFLTERLNGEDGVGAIYPSIAYTLMMFHVLGYPADHPDVVIAQSALEKLVAQNGEEAFCQPCLSPVWDTVLTAHALLESDRQDTKAAERALDWLLPLQVLDVKGDWAYRRPNLRPGGWAFQYRNDYYVDLDDTAVVVMAMDRARSQTGTRRYDEAISRAVEWVVGMQSSNGGWGAFDVDNTSYYLNAIPFADHGALLDPPTADVSARCLSMLGQLGETEKTSEAVRRGVAYLLKEQHPEGSWFGRWGINYIYGTWSVLCAFNAVGIDPSHPAVRRGVDWLVKIQNADGGWGEADAGYALDYVEYLPSETTASQTAWAVIGLMAAGEVNHPAVKRGIAWLEAHQGEDGHWEEPHYTGTGFPRVFYLRYNGYAKFFPLWALSRYRNLRQGNTTTVMYGM